MRPPAAEARPSGPDGTIHEPMPSPFVHLHCHSEYSILRRGVPDQRAGRPGGRAGDARRHAHRPRLHGRGARAVPRRGQGRHQADHRLRGLRRRGPAREGAAEPAQLGAPHAAGRDDGRLPQPGQARLDRLPRGLPLQAARRRRAAAAVLGRADRALRLPRQPCQPGAARRRQDEGARGARPARAAVSGATGSTSSCRTRAWRSTRRSTRVCSRSPTRPGCRSSARATCTTCGPRTPIPHEVLLCVQTGDELANPRRFRFPNKEFYFKTPDEMARVFAPYGRDLLRPTLEIAERCNVVLELDSIRLPRFDVPEGQDAVAYLRGLCEQGLQRRYGDGRRRPAQPARVRAQDDPGDGVRRLLPDRLGLRRLRQARGRRRRARAAARRRARWSPTAWASPTSTRSGTTCSSSGSSTPGASRCPTSTSTSRCTAASA